MSLGLRSELPQEHAAESDASTVTSTAALPSGGDLLGARGNTWHGVFNASACSARRRSYDSLLCLSELTWNHWDSVSQGMDVFKGATAATRRSTA